MNNIPAVSTALLLALFSPVLSLDSSWDCTPPDQWETCEDASSLYFPDRFNCRRFWHCTQLGSLHPPEHLLCPDDENGKPMMFDTKYNGCNYEYLTDCGSRPVCDECNQNCDEPGDCPPPLDCHNKPNGYYPDPHSCADFWICQGGLGYHYECQEGLYYEPVKRQCDWPENVDCGERPPCSECDQHCHQ